MLKTYLKVMKALADGNRVRIIKMLQVREMCVCELRAALDLAQPSVSKHLRILEEAGLVEGRKEGPWVNYRLPDATDSIYASQMHVILRQWLNDDREIKDLMREAASIDRCELTSRC
ncbi:MAG: ArsR/SmtB family transcription factor [Desulfobulbaceae bacterium]